MRRIRNPGSQSQCIFCTHRSLASIYYIHRRPLYSSRILSKPPGTATAPQKPSEDGESYNPMESASPQQSKSGGSNFDSATTASFESSTYGVKPAFAAAAPNFGSKLTFGPSGSSFGSNKPTFGARGPTFGAKTVFGGHVSSLWSNQSFGVEPANGIGRGTISNSPSTPTSKINPAFGGGQTEGRRAQSFGQTNSSFGSKSGFQEKEKEAQEKLSFERNPNLNARSTDGTRQHTAVSFGSNTTSHARPAGIRRDTSSRPGHLNHETQPVFGRDRRDEARALSFEKSSLRAEHLPGRKEREGQGSSSLRSNSKFGTKPRSSTHANYGFPREKNTIPKSEGNPGFNIAKSVAGKAEGNRSSNMANTPDFGFKSTFGASGTALDFGGSVKFGSKSTFGVAAEPGLNFDSNSGFSARPAFGTSTMPSPIGSQSTNPGRRDSFSPSSAREWFSQAPAPQSIINEKGGFKEAQEKEAKALARTEKRIPGNVYAKSGPESTRTDRPLPFKSRSIFSNSSSNDALGAFAGNEYGSQRRNENETADNDYNFTGSKPRADFSQRSPDTESRNTRIESQLQQPPHHDDLDSRTYDRSKNWTHLKKLQPESSSSQEQAQERNDRAFVIARAEREEQASSRRYVPLASRLDLNARQNEDSRNSWTRNSYGRTADHREDQRHTQYPRFDAYGHSVTSHTPSGPKVHDPYAPLGKNATPIPLEEWRNELPRRDDRLRRIYRDPPDFRRSDNTRYMDERNTRHDTAGRTDDSYDIDSRLQPSRNTQYSRHRDHNIEGGETSTSTKYKSSGPREEFRRSGNSYTYRTDHLNLGSRLEEESRQSPRSNYGISRSSENPRQSEKTLGSDKVSRSFGEVQKPTNSRDNQRRHTAYDELPKGKGRDKARRRQQFVESFEDVEDEAVTKAELKKKRKAEKAAKKAAALTPILLPEWISITNLAKALKVRLESFYDKLEDLGYADMGHDHVLGAEDAGLIAQEYGFEPIIDRSQDDDDLKSRPPAEDVSILPPRPPVVTIMGHVDHGKTTLLDWLRKSSIVDSEHGGITQHIGAFSVPMPSGKLITFLDTPGHAAFLSMRQRGANVTDIVILVVAADDSVMPQTIEAINHAKAAKVPVIVAINKIDKEDSDIERVKGDLARHGIEVEDIGGDTQAICVSGKTGQGMDDLEEAVVILSEILDMRAETDGQAEGWVIEASLKSMGKVATVLVKRGTMRVGDFIVAGHTWAKIRCMRNEAGIEIAEAGPGTPVEIDGWREQPLAGDEVLQAGDEGIAKRAVDYRLEKEAREKMAADMEAINDNRKAEQEKRDREKREAAIAAGKLPEEEILEGKAEDSIPGIKDVFFIVKGDVSGSVEAVTDSINALGTKEVRAKILRAGVGQLTESDVDYAAVAKGNLINFNTDVDPHISSLAARAGVSILDHNIIYKLVDDVKGHLSQHLAPIITQSVTGEAEIAQTFDITIKGRKQKPIAGCRVRNGVIHRASKVRVVRDGEKIFDGTFASLKNVKRDVLEMRKGTECGIGFENWADFRMGDLVQCYEVIETKRYL